MAVIFFKEPKATGLSDRFGVIVNGRIVNNQFPA